MCSLQKGQIEFYLHFVHAGAGYLAVIESLNERCLEPLLEVVVVERERTL